jgi:hypothetical protein
MSESLGHFHIVLTGTISESVLEKETESRSRNSIQMDCIVKA